MSLFFCRGEKTRTSDLYVPNVARCQLCYTPPKFSFPTANIQHFFQSVKEIFILPFSSSLIKSFCAVKCGKYRVISHINAGAVATTMANLKCALQMFRYSSIQNETIRCVQRTTNEYRPTYDK